MKILLKYSATCGAITFSDSSWWTTRDISIDTLLGDIDPSTVDYVELSSTTSFVVGYGNTKGGSTTNVGESYYDAYYVQTDAAEKHTFSSDEMAFVSFQDADGKWHGYKLTLALSKNDGVEYTIKWDVYTK